ncbi:hypothetical protein EGW08_012728 [Elysia chlorotica]|uniref:CBF1-interacting co-repressor CIR N-terminal domain-containing protein n=1 Tax=Elysia chlorotica TaxID=188477 RepID=A0A433TD60_ELYCH|nr:hypothetical protein EGW08_012728 [Elysia chlorotica]
MNILPHKSWHVRTKKNIERVRRDEEKAAEEEKEKQRRIALAEQEARTNLLRNKARSRGLPPSSAESGGLPSGSSANTSRDVSVAQPVSKDCVIPGLGDTKEHMNFFKDIEDGLVKQGTNKEHEAEKKKEQEELEKRIGLLTYLGQTALENKESAPWYLDKSLRKKAEDEEGEKKEDREAELKRAMQQKRMDEMDPLLQMKDYIEKKHKKHKKHKHKDKKRRHREEERKRKSLSSAAPSISAPAPKKTIEEMRAERIARERKEKLRAQALLSPSTATATGTADSASKYGAQKNRGDSSSSSDDYDSEGQRRGVKRRYNSQYNPEFVRQPKRKYHKATHSHGPFRT